MSMNMGRLGFLFPILAYLLIASSSLIPPTSCLPTLPDNAFALFVFGDGFYDTGNKAILDPDSQYNQPPYGETYFHAPTGRPSDGRLVVDFIAEKCGLPTIRPYLANVTSEWHYGVSFATAGASVTINNDTNLDFFKQIEYFDNVVNYLTDTYGIEPTVRLLEKSIYLFTLGTVDYVNLGPVLDLTKVAKTIDSVLNRFVNAAIVRAYIYGGRKFGFQNIGPLEKTPYSKNKWNNTIECQSFFQLAAPWNNIAMKDRLNLYKNCEPWFADLKYAYFDYFIVVRS